MKVGVIVKLSDVYLFCIFIREPI